jgi:hypothetical protein
MLLLLAFGLTGCFAEKAELDKQNIRIAQLEKQLTDLSGSITNLNEWLGDHKYQAVDPKLSATIKDVEFANPDKKYGTPSASFTLNFKQNNAELPLESYGINFTMELLNGSGNTVHEFYVSADIENGVGAKAVVEKFYSLDYIDKTFSIRIKDYYWYPEVAFILSDTM